MAVPMADRLCFCALVFRCRSVGFGEQRWDVLQLWRRRTLPHVQLPQLHGAELLRDAERDQGLPTADTPSQRQDSHHLQPLRYVQYYTAQQHHSQRLKHFVEMFSCTCIITLAWLVLPPDYIN